MFTYLPTRFTSWSIPNPPQANKCWVIVPDLHAFPPFVCSASYSTIAAPLSNLTVWHVVNYFIFCYRYSKTGAETMVRTKPICHCAVWTFFHAWRLLVVAWGRTLSYSCDTCTVPHGIYWLSSDLGRGPQASREKALPSQYIQCATSELCTHHSFYRTTSFNYLWWLWNAPDAWKTFSAYHWICLTVLYYKMDCFPLLGGGWALGNFSHTMPVSRYWHSSRTSAILCQYLDIGTVILCQYLDIGTVQGLQPYYASI